MKNTNLIRYPDSNIYSISRLFSLLDEIINPNELNNLIANNINKNISALTEILIPFRNKENWGHSNLHREIKIETKYQFIEPFYKNISIGFLENETHFINKKGECLLKGYNYGKYKFISDNLILIQNNEKGIQEIVNTKGEKIYLKENKEIPITDYAVLSFYNDCIIFNNYNFNDLKFGFLDILNLSYTECKYSSLWNYGEGLFSVSNNDSNNLRRGYINKNEELVIPHLFEHCMEFNCGLAGVKYENKYGFINKLGEMFIPNIYTRVRSFENNIAQVWQKRKWGIVNNLGNIVTPLIYERMNAYKNGYASVRINDKWGQIDVNGNEIIPCIYEDIKDFSQGLTPVKMNGKWGFLNTKNELVIDFLYQDTSCFNRFGFATVLINKESNSSNVIDLNGNMKIPKKYFIEFHYECETWGNRFILTEKNKVGCINENGEIIIPFIWDKLQVLNNDFVRAILNNRVIGYIDKNGKQFWND